VSNAFFPHLAAHNARMEGDVVVDFGDAPGELAATASGSVVAPLAQFGVIAFAGEDAREFLHRQLSCDVEHLADDAGAYGACCSPKGRVLANFLLWHDPDAVCMLLPRSVLPAIRKHLERYVLRSKVTTADRTEELVVLGASGPDAAAAVAGIVGQPSGPAALRIARRALCAAVALPGGRFLVIAPLALGPRIWDQLARILRPVGTACWDWLEIANGLPWITAATQDQFVPQMANLELVGGVSFQKGCYPGQEIVARTQHLGRPKRRLYRAHVRAGSAPVPGATLYSDDLGDQAAGTIVNAASAPGGGFDVLAVVQTASAASAAVRLGSRSGAQLHFRSLPYSVPPD
jgi:hypothetical protein